MEGVAFAGAAPGQSEPRGAASERGLSLTLPSPLPDNVLGTYHALIIGINDHQQWNPLQTAVNHATALRENTREVVDPENLFHTPIPCGDWFGTKRGQRGR